MERIKAVFNWSGGKDSAHALLRAQQSGEYEIVALLTTVNRDTHRSTMHGIPTALLQMQAESIGVPLYIVDLTPKGNMEDYDVAMSRAVEHFKTQGVTRFHLRGYFPARCAQIPGAATLAARNRNRGTALGKIFGRGDERFPRIGISDGRRNHDGRRTRRRRHRPGDRPRLHSLSACRSRSQWRKRRISYILLRRSVSSDSPCRSGWADLFHKATTSA